MAVVVTSVTVDCGANQLLVHGTSLNTYSTVVVTGPDGGTLAKTVTSVTATLMTLTMTLPITAGGYCVKVDALTPTCVEASCIGLSYPLRRSRRFALPFDQNRLVYVRRLEIIIQSGMSNDQPMFYRVSKDGGLSFASFYPLASGSAANYTKRLFANRLGRGRNWVVEVMTDTPDPWYLIEANCDYEYGQP